MGAISTQDMVTDCKARVPIRVANSFWIARLNEAYRWICQNGNYPWMVIRSSCDVQTDGSFFLGSWNGARPIYIWKNGLLIPKKSWEEATKHQMYASEIETPGNYSCWAARVDYSGGWGQYTYYGQMFPTASYPAAPDATLEIAYHYLDLTPIPESSSNYFYTPPEFDELVMALAESEARRRYGISGWEKIQMRAQASATNLLKIYTSEVHSQLGALEQQRHAVESQAAKST